ncbi:MAG: type II toxin-antitoxin system RelE/ParE family toxin [Planctomycetaceae bacterium]|nr:type II toxin-antitoxin system RelE/ParE family toxin [Planctomycetaceae bacterium]
MADVELTTEALQQFADLPRGIRPRVDAIFARLEDWPDVSGAKPLSGKLAGHWRMRTGDYRVQFSVRGDTITVDKVGHRDRFYDD